ncbi:MAG: hypothetical protein ACK4PI_00080 [Tepidisphaerales bacterium]
MGIRETLNEKPQLVTGIAIGILALAVILIAVQLFGGSRRAEGRVSNKQFFTVDDGQTLFVDDISKIPPFDHQGKQAVRAKVFTCDGGRTRFVGYLERYSPQAIEAMQRAAAGGDNDTAQMQLEAGLEVKRPGETRWTPFRDGEGYRIIAVQCPEGTPGPLEAVLP